MEKKLLSSKDHEHFLDKIEGRTRGVKTSTSVGNDGTELNTWKEQRNKSVQKPKESVQLSLFNRFSHWEDANADESDVEDDSNDKDCSDDNNEIDELTYSPKTVGDKCRAVKFRFAVFQNNSEIEAIPKKKINKERKKLNSKQNLFNQNRSQEYKGDIKELLKTENRSDVSQEMEVEETVAGMFKLKSKRKCRKCGYKSNCHSKENCKSEGLTCFACLKPSHFPKSPDCKRNKIIKLKPVYGCLRLKQSLKRGLKENIVEPKQLNKEKKSLILSEKDIKIIKERITFIEKIILSNRKLENLSNGSKVLLLSYVLFNINHLYVKGHESDERVQMKQKEQNMHNEKDNDEDFLIIPEQIEDFLTVSHNSTHIIENFVEPEEGNLEMVQTNERIRTHEGKIKLYRNKLDKFVENGGNDHDIEAVRSSDAICFEDIVKLITLSV